VFIRGEICFCANLVPLTLVLLTKDKAKGTKESVLCALRVLCG
jgi:hypothetical protein